MRTIVITGASSGIGRAAARAFARCASDASPIRLVLVARRERELDETAAIARVAAHEPQHLEVEIEVADVGDTNARRELGELISARHPQIHVLVNNAGVGSRSDIDDDVDVQLADHIQQLNVNLIAPIELTTLLLPSLRAARGAVVNVASVAGLLGTARAPVYSATKFGLSGWSEALHARLHDEGVRVACVHPGPVPTPGWPHSRVMSSRWSRWLAAPPETIAETIVRASEPGGPLTPIRPRVYRLVSITRATIPPLGRALARSTRSFTSD